MNSGIFKFLFCDYAGQASFGTASVFVCVLMAGIAIATVTVLIKETLK